MTYTPEERKARNDTAQARYRARHPEQCRAKVARSREKHRDEINARQRAKYHERKAAEYLRRKAAGYYAKKDEAVIGTMGAVEAPDRMEFTAPNLREKYLAALLARDAVIWHRYYRACDHAQAADDAMSPQQAARAKLHTLTYKGPACQKCGSTERYNSTKECVACVKSRMKRGSRISSARAEAKAAGRKTYIREHACDKCGGNVYLVSNWSCVVCRRARASERAVHPSVPRLAPFNRRANVSGPGRGQSIPQAKTRQFATR